MAECSNGEGRAIKNTSRTKLAPLAHLPLLAAGNPEQRLLGTPAQMSALLPHRCPECAPSPEAVVHRQTEDQKPRIENTEAFPVRKRKKGIKLLELTNLSRRVRANTAVRMTRAQKPSDSTSRRASGNRVPVSLSAGKSQAYVSLRS